MAEKLKAFVRELQERHVLRTAVLYLGAGWVALEFIGFVVDNYAPERVLLDVSLLLIALGFPIALIISWFHGKSGRQGIPRAEAIMVGALILIGAAGSTWMLVGAEPAAREAVLAPIGPEGASLGDRSVAVLPLVNNTGADSLDWLGPGLADMLTTNLAQLPSLRVVSAQRLLDLMRQAGRAETERIPDDLALSLAARSGARTLVRGSFLAIGSEVRVDIQLIDLTDGTITGAERARGPDLFALVDDVSARVSSRLLGSRIEPTELTPLAQLATGNLEAYRAYQEGLQAERRFLTQEADERYRRAVELDSTFAIAWLRLGLRAFNENNFQAGLTALQKADRHSEGASERDRLMIEAMFALISGDAAEGESLFQRLIARYPDAKEARVFLAGVYAQSGRIEERRQVLEEVLRLDPYYAPAVNELAYMAARRGDEAAADSLSLQYQELEPDQANPYDSRGEILEMFGRDAEAREAFRGAIGVEPGFTLSYDHLIRSYLRKGDAEGARSELGRYMTVANPDAAVEVRGLEGDTYLAEGRYRDGLAAYRRAADRASEAGRVDLRLRGLLPVAGLAALTGDYAAAEEAFREAFEIDPANQNVLFGVLSMYGRQGRLEDMRRVRRSATERLESAPAVIRTPTQVVSRAIDGLLAWYEGEPEASVRHFQAARSVGSVPADAWIQGEEVEALIQVGRAEDALALIDGLERAASTGHRANPLAAQQAWVHRGHAYEALGRPGEALKSYERLLDAVGDGAREITFMRDVPERVARLRATVGAGADDD